MKAALALFGALACAAAAQAQVAQADVDYWTRGYDGTELVQSIAQCPDPAIPEVSQTNKDIKGVIERFNRWNDCYEAALGGLGLDKPPVSHIPAPIRFGMTVDDYKLASTHMDLVYANAISTIGKQAAPVIAQFDAWRGKTEQYVRTVENDRQVRAELESILADQRKRSGVGVWGKGQFGTISR